jgi:Predicted glutamine amidotransferases
MRPLVGIPCRAGVRGELKRPVYHGNQAYVHAVENAGGVPILIPFMEDPASLQSLLPRLDGILLPGGVDVHPYRYHEEVHKAVREVDPQLDELELALANWAWQNDVPLLGICRGMQLLNVSRGGTLYQDLPSQHPGDILHSNWAQPRGTIIHDIHVVEGSHMHEILGESVIAVNSLHHQAVKEPGAGLVVSGTAPDGVIELIEAPERSFVLATQCHPEELYKEHPVWSRLFEAFVNACVERLSRQLETIEVMLPVTQ